MLALLPVTGQSTSGLVRDVAEYESEARNKTQNSNMQVSLFLSYIRGMTCLITAHHREAEQSARVLDTFLDAV